MAAQLKSSDIKNSLMQLLQIGRVLSGKKRDDVDAKASGPYSLPQRAQIF